MPASTHLLVTNVNDAAQECSGCQDRSHAADAVTICDLTGTGVQDTAIATLALARARARGLGTTIRA